MATDILSLTRLSRGAETTFELVPDADARAALASALDLSQIRKLRFAGKLIAEGKRDWRLEAQLGATVVQPCVVTLKPVTTRIDEPVLRRYLADLPDPEADEIEMPEDDTLEPLPATLNLSEVLAEALALAVPDFPRADGVGFGEASFTEPGVTPMSDEEAKPLAGLAALRDVLSKRDPDEGSDD